MQRRRGRRKDKRTWRKETIIWNDIIPLQMGKTEEEGLVLRKKNYSQIEAGNFELHGANQKTQ